MSYNFIDTDDLLESCCRELLGSPWLALDTEFMREKTYYPRLCLIQIAVPGNIFCIDMLTIGDPAPLAGLLEKHDITKVFHAARQDLEALYFLFGAVPAPVFDTQVAAGLLGFDDQLGYATLVEALTGAQLTKAYQRTDWAKRPLPRDQLDYAADDVRYLCQLYPILIERLESAERLAWVQEDCDRLLDPALYATDPMLAYQRIKQGRTLNPKQQQVLLRLASWRETVAQKQDRPRQWLAKDNILIYLAQTAPQTATQLEEVRGLSEEVQQRHGTAILSAINTGLGSAHVVVFDDMAPLDAKQLSLYERLNVQIRAMAEKLGLRASVLAPRRELNALIRGDASSKLLSGWRRQVVGEELLRFVASPVASPNIAS